MTTQPLSETDKKIAENVAKLIQYGAKCYMNGEASKFERFLETVFPEASSKALVNVVREEALLLYRQIAGLIH